MANSLDEQDTQFISNGNDTHVIAKKLNVELSMFTRFIPILVWIVAILGIVIALLFYFFTKSAISLIIAIVFFIPCICYYLQTVKAKEYLMQLEQNLQNATSKIDNYLEQRVIILKNTSALVEKAIKFDKETFVEIAKLRSGNKITDENRNEISNMIDTASRSINVAFENYPDLKAHESIQNAMQENSYLQKEVTAARENYNDLVLRWNRKIFEWPIYQLVANKNGYTTRIPFSTTEEIKKESKEVLF